MKIITLAVALLVAAGSLTVNATTVNTSFGSLPSATWGGSGIPNGAVSITTISGLPNSDTITLGLTATPRYSAGELANNGAGTFYASPGISSPGLANWNFDYYIGISGGEFANYHFVLSYGNNSLTYSFDPVAIANADGGKSVTATTREDSENLGWFLPFNPNANGTYNYDLKAYDSDLNLLGDSLMTVQVGQPVSDGGSTAGMLGIGAIGMVFVKRKFGLAA
ncbi:MAG: hypothetical protein KGI49_00950 [Patescibacteria group bacterium]|nr:hypothetical protein [Patescibacteria group bacterium]